MSTSTATSVDGTELIAHPIRRHLCSILDRDGSIEVETLAARVVGRTPDGTADDAQRLLITLRHDHLPRLADRGIVRYVPGRETVSLPDGVSFEDDTEGRVTYVTIADPSAETADDSPVSNSKSDRPSTR